MAWTGSKGVVGECWTNRTHVYRDKQAVAARYGGTPISAEQFARIPISVRGGFALSEFVAIVEKYTEVLAEPIWHGGKDGVLVGVLSIDRGCEPNENQVRVLGKRSTRETAATAAASIGSILKPRVTET